jgi:hypothetical protein
MSPKKKAALKAALSDGMVDGPVWRPAAPYPAHCSEIGDASFLAPIGDSSNIIPYADKSNAASVL